MTNEAAWGQAVRIRQATQDVHAGLGVSYEEALDLVTGVLIGDEQAIKRLGLGDEVMLRLGAIEAKYGGMARARGGE